jgi:ABC-2 type transport system ATP-binding protein
MSAILRITNLSKRYGKAAVLDGLNVEVPPGSVYGFIGPNGAGKTTTIKVLMNIIKANSGTAEVLGVDSRTLGPAALAKIGYVSENQELPEWMTVDYLLRYVKPFYPTWDDARSDQLVREFNLPREREIRHLSRGMKMKVALVSALAYRPALLVMDEPFTGLDVLVREELIEGLIDSIGETSIFISSHDLGEIETFASHIGYLEGGRLLFSEEMTSLAARFREIEVVVDSPAVLPDRQWPSNWLRFEANAALVRFVETQFEPDRTPNEIRKVFAGVQHISVNPMPLRAIFLTLARSASKTA